LVMAWLVKFVMLVAAFALALVLGNVVGHV
jgi:hypothetical protein